MSAVVAFAAMAITAGSARAQQTVTLPLGDIARQAEAAKPTVRKATRTYTNGSLASVPGDEPAVAAPTAGVAFESRSLGKALSAEEMIARSEAKVESDRDNAARQSEPTWRMQAESLRKQIDDMQSRISPMLVPNPLTEADPILKKSNDSDIANARAALDGLKKQWTRLEAAAGEAKIPTAWLDPRPQRQ